MLSFYLHTSTDIELLKTDIFFPRRPVTSPSILVSDQTQRRGTQTRETQKRSRHIRHHGKKNGGTDRLAD